MISVSGLQRLIAGSLRARREIPARDGVFHLVAAFACMFFGMMAAASLRPVFADADAAMSKAVITGVSSGAMIAAGLALLALAPRLGVERQRAADWRLTLVFSLLGVLVFVPAVLGCSMLSARLFLLLSGAAPEPISHSTLAELVEEPDRASVVIWSVVLVTLVPLGEELIFRVFVQSAVLSVAKSEFVSILLTSVLFAMMHFPVLESASEGAAKFVLLLPLFVLGLGGGWLYERTRSVVAPAGFHGAFNLVNIVIAFGMFGG